MFANEFLILVMLIIAMITITIAKRKAQPSIIPGLSACLISLRHQSCRMKYFYTNLSYLTNIKYMQIYLSHLATLSATATVFICHCLRRHHGYHLQNCSHLNGIVFSMIIT